MKLDQYRRAYEVLRDVNALYDQVVWDEEIAQQYACADGGEIGLLGLPSAFRSCIWRTDGDAGEGEKTLQTGPADAVADGGEDAEVETNEETRKEENEYFAGVDDEHASFDGEKIAKHIEVLLRRQALLKAQRREEEINTRKKLRDLGTRNASQFISQGHCEKIKATEKELQMEFSKLRKARMESELKEAEQTLDKRISPPCGGSPVEWRGLAIGKTQIVVPTHTKMLDMFDPRDWTATRRRR